VNALKEHPCVGAEPLDIGYDTDKDTLQTNAQFNVFRIPWHQPQVTSTCMGISGVNCQEHYVPESFYSSTP
jgi:hypothetical protein